MPRRRKRIGVDVWVLWRDFKGAARAIFLGLMWNSWMTKTDDGVMMKKWCCTGLFLGEISEICWYMCIYIYIHRYYGTVWILVIHHYHDIIGVVISFWVIGGSISVVPFEKDKRQWSTSWSSKMRPKIKRRQPMQGNCHWPPVGHGSSVHFWWKAPWPRSFKCC